MSKRIKITVILSVLLVLVMGLSMVEAQEVIEIEYWQYSFAPRVAAMDMLIEQFEAENPDVRVIQNSEIVYDNFRDQIAASAPAGVGPDVVTLFYGWIPAFIDAGYLVPLPQDEFPPEWIESYFSPMVAGSKFEGEYWAIPTAVRSLALFWNKDIFEAAGLDPESPPTTLDELVEMAQATTSYDGNGTDILNITTQGYGIGLNAQDHHWFREVLVRQFGGVPYSEDNRTVLWGGAEGCEAFKYLTQFELELMTGSNDLFDGVTNAFVNGNSAMHIDGSFRLGSIASNNPDLNFGVAELPVGPNGEQSTFGSYWTHGITRRAAADEARMDASVRFLKFITTADAGRLWVENVGELPAQLEAASDPEVLANPLWNAFSAGLEYSHATFFVDESAQRQVLIDAYDQVKFGADPCEALAEAAEIEQELIDEFWDNRG
jgi:multiple sugar transport system substrate-binding protein